jgi:hypothetical protein
MTPPQKKFENLPLSQKIDVTKNLMPYPALTLMVFLRRDLGYRLLNPTWLWGVTIVEIVIAVVLHPPNGRPNTLFDFAVVSCGLGMIQRLKRKRELAQGILQHSFYLGDSRLRFRWLPGFVKHNRRVERFVEPALFFLTGTILLLYQPLLGFWLVIAAACLRVVEADVYDKTRNRELDMMDSLIVSKGQSEVVEKFEGPTPGSTGSQMPEPKVPTGMADDIAAHIKRRKAKHFPTKPNP